MSSFSPDPTPSPGPSERFNRANGPRIRELRKARGWTQLTLASRTGYSERVIRKAEKSEPIRHDVLATIAQALSTPAEPITVAMLTSDPVQIVRRFYEAYDVHEREMLPHVHDVLAPDVKFVFYADPERNPLSGTWEGVRGIQAYLDKFFGMFVRQNKGKQNPQYIVNGQQVVASFSEIVCYGEVVAPPVWIHLKFSLRDGRIALVEDFCDTDTAARFLKEIGVPGRAPGEPPHPPE